MRLYKIAGLFALTAILVGLIGFLVVNVFYFFDHTWVRPVKLSPNHQKVIEASTQLADAKLRAAQISTDESEASEELNAIKRTIDADKTFLAEAKAAPKPDLLVLREIEKADLDVLNQEGRKKPLQQRIESLKLRQKDEDALVQRLAGSPYLKAMEQQIVLAFVPNQNLGNVKIGTALYGCRWGLILCHKVGTVTSVLDGEVQDQHPHDESIQRGVMVEINVTKDGADDSVLFAGGKPLVFI
ncbi:MAG TPA: hypothetical protein VGM88_35470 [Kofleriaceae bacterium]